MGVRKHVDSDGVEYVAVEDIEEYVWNQPDASVYFEDGAPGAAMWLRDEGYYVYEDFDQVIEDVREAGYTVHDSDVECNVGESGTCEVAVDDEHTIEAYVEGKGLVVHHTKGGNYMLRISAEGVRLTSGYRGVACDSSRNVGEVKVFDTSGNRMLPSVDESVLRETRATAQWNSEGVMVCSKDGGVVQGATLVEALK